MVKKIVSILFLSILTFNLSACTNPDGSINKRTAGTAVGALGGAAIGSMFGGGTGRIVGTAIGATAGAVAGNYVGGEMEKNKDKK